MPIIKKVKNKDKNLKHNIVEGAVGLLLCLAIGVVLGLYVGESIKPNPECGVCHEQITTRYCTNCGTKAMSEDEVLDQVCPVCYRDCNTPFCGECGAKVD